MQGKWQVLKLFLSPEPLESSGVLFIYRSSNSLYYSLKNQIETLDCFLPFPPLPLPIHFLSCSILFPVLPIFLPSLLCTAWWGGAGVHQQPAPKEMECKQGWRSQEEALSGGGGAGPGHGGRRRRWHWRVIQGENKLIETVSNYTENNWIMKPVFLAVGESTYTQGKGEDQKQPCWAELEVSAKRHIFQFSSQELCADFSFLSELWAGSPYGSACRDLSYSRKGVKYNLLKDHWPKSG